MVVSGPLHPGLWGPLVYGLHCEGPDRVSLCVSPPDHSADAKTDTFGMRSRQMKRPPAKPLRQTAWEPA